MKQLNIRSTAQTHQIGTNANPQSTSKYPSTLSDIIAVEMISKIAQLYEVKSITLLPRLVLERRTVYEINVCIYSGIMSQAAHNGIVTQIKGPEIMSSRYKSCSSEYIAKVNRKLKPSPSNLAFPESVFNSIKLPFMPCWKTTNSRLRLF